MVGLAGGRVGYGWWMIRGEVVFPGYSCSVIRSVYRWIFNFTYDES